MKTIVVFTCAMSMLLATLWLLDANAEPVAATAPGSQPASRPADPEVTADAVIRQLMTERGREAVLPEAATAPTVQPPTAVPVEIVKPLPAPPGAMIVNRLGRLIKDESSTWWQFHFESERSVLYEAPIRVMPNRLLEAMETILENSGRTRVRFKVTGEVTHYRGRRYLLIRRMLVKREIGAL